MILFLGDSITEWWDKQYFEKYFSMFEPVNLGMAGHTSKDTMDFINLSEIHGLEPSIIILMIGTNDADKKFTTGKTLEYIKYITSKLLYLSPKSRILLMGPLPRGETPSDPRRVYNKEVNKLLSREKFDERIVYLDNGYLFLKDGIISRKMMYDFLHLTIEGYRHLSESVFGNLLVLLGSP